jgi:rfaE bifunctional protein nucleotidyltransferase chain/domain
VVLARGGAAGSAVREAVAAASAWVAGGGAEGFRRASAAGGAGLSHHDLAAERALERRADAATGSELERLADRLRAGGTLVATGGCFDLLHAGHVATLESAGALGDRLVVLVNSDASVRRLKGPGRPVVPAADRVRVLEALDCVDAAVVFDDDDPRDALAHLRPDVWVKGGDYAIEDLPEAEVVAAYGGRAVVVPYLAGRSTTSILRRVESTA